MIETRTVRRFLSRKSSLLAILVLALGMGTSVAFFSVADTVLFHPVPVKDLNRLVVIIGAFQVPGAMNSVSWWGQAPSLAALTEYRAGWGTLRWGGRSGTVLATAATPEFFQVFDVRPLLGRSFRASDQEPGATGVAVLSRHLWEKDFEGSPDVVGRQVVLDGTPLQIIGVAPAGFQFPGRTDLWVAEQLHAAGSVWIRLGTNGRSDGRSAIRMGWVIGRLRQGATIAQARADMAVLLARVQPELTPAKEDLGARPPSVGSLREAVSRNSRSAVLLLFGGSLFLLLVACLNAGNLLLAQSVARERETAIRRCLGATPWRIARQMLGESAMLATVGGALGVALAWWGVSLLRHAGSAQIAGLSNAQVLPLAIGFALVSVLLAGLVSGAAPALDARNIEPGRWLGGEGQVSSARLAPPARKIFAGGQIALAFVLIAGAAGTVKTLYKLLQTNPGFDPNGVIALNVVPVQRSNRTESGAAIPNTARRQSQPKHRATAGQRPRNEARLRVVALDRALVDRVRRVPGVTSVGLVHDLPFGGQGTGSLDLDSAGRINVAEAQVMTVGGDYFRTLKIPLLAGRTFSDEADNSGAVIINQRLAEDIWGSENAVGKWLNVEGPGPRRVIGVVGNAKFSSLAPSVWKYGSTQLYFPMDDPSRGGPAAFSIVVRTSGKPGGLLPELRGAIESVDPDAAVYGAATMNSLIGESVGGLRFRGVLLGFFALAAVVLGLLGVYGVASFAASRRTREFALRMALGARPGEIVPLAAREAGVFIPAGIGAGVGLTLAVSKVAGKFLPGMKAADPATMAGVAMALALMAVGAALLPAIRAGRIHPSEALRYE